MEAISDRGPITEQDRMAIMSAELFMFSIQQAKKAEERGIRNPILNKDKKSDH